MIPGNTYNVKLSTLGFQNLYHHMIRRMTGGRVKMMYKYFKLLNLLVAEWNFWFMLIHVLLLVLLLLDHVLLALLNLNC